LGGPCALRLPRPTRPRYAQSGVRQHGGVGSTWRGRPRLAVRGGGGAGGGRAAGSCAACAQAAQQGWRVRPGTGWGALQRWPGGGRGWDGFCSPPGHSFGPAACSMTQSQRSPRTMSWEKKRCATMATPPSHGREMGVLYLMCWRRHYPHAGGTRPHDDPRDSLGPSPGLCRHAPRPRRASAGLSRVRRRSPRSEAQA